MRILLITTHLDVGGIPNYTVTLARVLASRGHDLVVVSSGGALVERLDGARIAHHTVDVRTKSEFHPKVSLGFLRLVHLIRRFRPHLIHAQTRVTQVIAGLASSVTGVPMVSTAHGFYRWHAGRKLFPFLGRQVIAISSTVRDQLIEKFHVAPDRVTLVLNGIDWQIPSEPVFTAQVARFRDAFGIGEGRPVIGSVARLAAVKGHRTLLDAFHRVRAKFPEVLLLIVGDGPERARLVSQAYDQGDQDCIVLSGTTDHTAIPLSVMQVFVQPSLQEGFGLAAVEAMAMARPVVASAVEGLLEVVVDGETGFLVPPGDPQALALALECLLKEPAKARALGQAGRRRFEQQFTVERVVREVEAVYAQVVGEVG